MSEIPPNTVCQFCGQLMTPQDRGFCPRCRRTAGSNFAQPPPPMRPQTSVNSTRQAIFIVLFILIGLPSCALGGCFLMMGTGSPQTEPGVLAVGFGGIFVFIVLLVLMIKYSKK